jgi:threonine/homoserine/homoserine lactone efflux protein
MSAELFLALVAAPTVLVLIPGPKVALIGAGVGLALARKA